MQMMQRSADSNLWIAIPTEVHVLDYREVQPVTSLNRIPGIYYVGDFSTSTESCRLKKGILSAYQSLFVGGDGIGEFKLQKQLELAELIKSVRTLPKDLQDTLWDLGYNPIRVGDSTGWVKGSKIYQGVVSTVLQLVALRTFMESLQMEIAPSVDEVKTDITTWDVVTLLEDLRHELIALEFCYDIQFCVTGDPHTAPKSFDCQLHFTYSNQCYDLKYDMQNHQFDLDIDTLDRYF